MSQERLVGFHWRSAPMSGASSYDPVEIQYVKAEDVERILFTAEENSLSQSSSHQDSDRSLITSTELLHDVKSIPLEEHISSDQWLNSVHSLSESGKLPFLRTLDPKTADFY